jgi:hypothetical protein
LLFICALVLVSISGCTSSSTSTATPTVKATATAQASTIAQPSTSTGGRDALLVKLADAWKNRPSAGLDNYKMEVRWRNPTPPLQTLEARETWTVIGVQHSVVIQITKYPTVQEASNTYAIFTDQDLIKDSKALTTYVYDDWVNAAGRAPTTRQATGGHWESSSQLGGQAFVQYDNYYIHIAQNNPGNRIATR